jgi:endoglucanase
MTAPPPTNTKPTRRTILKVAAVGVAGVGTGSFMLGRGGSLLDARDRILVNQAGYGVNWPKQARIDFASSNRPQRVAITVHQAESGNVIEERALPLKKIRRRNGVLDLTDLSASGRIFLRSGESQSQPFEINGDPFGAVRSSLIDAFGIQACGVALTDNGSGLSHAPCHLNDAFHAHSDDFAQKGQRRHVSGGWHDAGDYGKYVATTALTIGEILSAHVTASQGAPSDILNTMRPGLEWLLAMQRSDGAMYRKVASDSWPQMSVAPDTDMAKRFVYGISSADTAKAAAVFAIGSRAYAQDRDVAKRCKAACEQAWNYLQANPDPHVDEHEGDNNGSGNYLTYDRAGQAIDKFDRFWAATERYLLTKKAADHRYFQERFNENGFDLISWANPSAIGLLNYLKAGRGGAGTPSRPAVKQSLLKLASKLYGHGLRDPYGLAHLDFVWGSNRRTAAAGLMLAAGYEETQHYGFLEAALSQVGFLLGLNPFDMSFVTGSSAKAVKNVHHRFAIVADREIPGLLVGGPNNNAESGIAPRDSGVLSYADDTRSFATNEFAIEYNGALIHLLTKLQSLKVHQKQDWLFRLLQRIWD